MCSGFYQWYQWYTNIVQGSTNGTIGKTIGTNGNASVTTGSPNGTIGIIVKPMVPLATNAVPSFTKKTRITGKTTKYRKDHSKGIW